MDPTEQLVFDHLLFRGYTDIVYEPDGNVPPDFRVNGTIAIEVRRLNQNHNDGTRTKGLEEVSIPLWRKVKDTAASFGPPVAGESWFVYFRFSRPHEPWKTLEPILKDGLNKFVQSSNKSRGIIAKAQGFELEVFRASTPRATMFVMGGCSDQQSGGWLIPEMQANIQYVSDEKARKTASVRTKYPQWWLALADHIGYGLDNLDREFFREQVSIVHHWDKILIIDPRDHKRWFEV